MFLLLEDRVDAGQAKTTDAHDKIIAVITTDTHCHLPSPAASMPQGYLRFHHMTRFLVSKKQSLARDGFCPYRQVLPCEGHFYPHVRVNLSQPLPP